MREPHTSTRGEGGESVASGGTPGARTRTQGLVQRQARGSAPPEGNGPQCERLPFMDVQMQRDRGAPERGRGRERVMVEDDLRRNLVTWIGTLGAAQANESRSFEVTARIPCGGIFGVLANFSLEVGRDASGYTLEAEGQLGAGVLGPGVATGLTGLIRCEAHGHDPTTIANMLLFSIEQAVRSGGRGVSDTDFRALLAEADRNGRQVPRAKPDFFDWLANLMFHDGAEQVLGPLDARGNADAGEMAAGDYIDWGFGIAQPSSIRGGGASGSLAYGVTANQRMEREEDGDIVRSSSAHFQLDFSVTFGGFGAKISVEAPGQIALEMQVQVPVRNIETRFFVDAVTRITHEILTRLPRNNRDIAPLRAQVQQMREDADGLGARMMSVTGGLANNALQTDVYVGLNFELPLTRGARPTITPFVLDRRQFAEDIGNGRLSATYENRRESPPGG
jgi:hypothetical protein